MSTDIAAEPVNMAARHRKPTWVQVMVKAVASWLGSAGKKFQEWELALLPQSTLFEIESGDVVINRVSLIHDLFDVKVFDLDLESEFGTNSAFQVAEPVASADLEVYFRSSTGLPAGTDKMTVLRVGLPHTVDSSEWGVSVLGSGYEANVVLFRKTTASRMQRAYWWLTKRTPQTWDLMSATEVEEEVTAEVMDTDSVVVTAPVTQVVDGEIVTEVPVEEPATADKQ